MSLIQKINEIAHAVQDVSGSSDPLTLDEMPDRIRELGSAVGAPISFDSYSYSVTIDLQKVKALLEEVGFDLNQSIDASGKTSSSRLFTIGFGLPIRKSSILPYAYESSGEWSYTDIYGPDRRQFTLEIDTSSEANLLGYLDNYFSPAAQTRSIPTTFNDLFNYFAGTAPRTFSAGYDFNQLLVFPILIIDYGFEGNPYICPLSQDQFFNVLDFTPSGAPISDAQ